MCVNFFASEYQQRTRRKLFGLCDNPPPPPSPAYLDEINGRKWIAVVINEYQFEVLFIPVDNNIELRKADGMMDNRCDGLLSYLLSTVIFIELKQRTDGSAWIKEGENQLRQTIKHFERTKEAISFRRKRAYIANCKRPQFRINQTNRMDKFHRDTGYILRIENRIILD